MGGGRWGQLLSGVWWAQEWLYEAGGVNSGVVV